MSSAARKGLTSRRYMMTKLFSATEEFMHQLFSAPASSAVAATASQSGQTSTLAQAVAKFRETYTKPMTMSMYITGAAMCPSLNRRALKEPEAVEKLVVRLLPRPSSRTVWVGDVVALNSPLGKPSDPAQVMVRRVAAVEGMEMVSEGTDEEDFAIPMGHCWVLADNPDMKPPNVIDSRTYGFVPMSNILGRVIYSGTSASEHAPVTNSPLAQAVDDPVLEQEVEVEGLFTEEEGEEEAKGQEK